MNNMIRGLSKKFKISNIRIKKKVYNNNLKIEKLCKKGNIDINDINYSKSFWELNKEYKYKDK